MSDVAIKVEGLGKKYQIGKSRSGDLRETFGNLFRRKSTNRQVDKLAEFWALEDISFEIPRGEAVGIIGRNGAGKSTLLKILSRITQPTTGRVEINGRVSSLLEVGTGFHPELMGRENIYLNGTILGMKRKEVKAKFDEIVDFSGVEKFLDTPIKHYSSGMKVRLAFSVAAHLEPEVLLIDEVLAVGDMEFQKKCLGKMEEIAEQGRTILFVSHNLEAVSNLTTSSIWIDEGRTAVIGTSDLVIGKYIRSSLELNTEYLAEDQQDRPHIQSIKIYTSEEGNVHIANQPFSIKIRLSTPRALKGACISFQIKDLTNRNLVHQWLFDSERPICRVKGIHELIFNTNKLRLYRGRYYLTAFFTGPPNTDIYDVVSEVCPFEVVMHGIYREFDWKEGDCAYLQEGTWDVKKYDFEVIQ